MSTNQTSANVPNHADGRPAAGRAPTAAHARAVARLVAPLVADALALRRRLEQCRAADAADGTPPLVGVFADQLLASAELLAECMHGAAGADAPGQDAPNPDAPNPNVQRLLADEARVARRLRRAIAACDAHADDRTADRLEEVLDEVERQRWFLAGFLSTTAE